MTPSRSFLPGSRSGIAIDALAVVAHIFLFPRVMSRLVALFDSALSSTSSGGLALSAIMAVVLAGRLGGLHLKRFGLQARLGPDNRGSFLAWFYIFNVVVVLVTSAFVVVLASALLARLGVLATSYSGQPKVTAPVMVAGIAAMLALVAVETLLLYRLLRPLTAAAEARRAAGSWKFGRVAERAADLGLFGYVMIWQAFYSFAAHTLMTPTSAHDELSPGMQAGSALFLLILFALFYLSPRSVFLLEDRRHPFTWLSIACVYVSSIVTYW